MKKNNAIPSETICFMDNCVGYSTYSRSFPDRELQKTRHISNAVVYI